MIIYKLIYKKKPRFQLITLTVGFEEKTNVLRILNTLLF